MGKSILKYRRLRVRHRLRHHSGGRQGPYLPSADSSEHDLKRGELRFMLPKVMRTSGAFTVGVLIMIKRRVLRLHAFCHFLLNLVQYSNNFLVLLQ